MPIARLPTSTPKRPEPTDDDTLGELPPLDGESEEPTEVPAEDLDDADEGGENLLDDATGEADPVDDLDEAREAEGAEGGWLDDAADAEELDVGPHELDDQERTGLLEDADEPGVGDEDFGLEPA